MNPIGFLFVGMGATLGAWLRWGLGAALNPLFPSLPLGTLVANLAGAYLIGVAIEFFAQNAHFPPEARLMVITGFMGALTTYSTFSAEVVTAIGRGEYLWATAEVLLHLLGSLAFTALGIVTVKSLARVALT